MSSVSFPAPAAQPPCCAHGHRHRKRATERRFSTSPRSRSAVAGSSGNCASNASIRSSKGGMSACCSTVLHEPDFGQKQFGFLVDHLARKETHPPLQKMPSFVVHQRTSMAEPQSARRPLFGPRPAHAAAHPRQSRCGRTSRWPSYADHPIRRGRTAVPVDRAVVCGTGGDSDTSAAHRPRREGTGCCAPTMPDRTRCSSSRSSMPVTATHSGPHSCSRIEVLSRNSLMTAGICANISATR